MKVEMTIAMSRVDTGYWQGIAWKQHWYWLPACPVINFSMF
jgi:hypothetical protein